MKYSALIWVKTTINDNLKETLNVLKQFIESPDDNSSLQPSLLWLHEMHGVLEILQLKTAAMLVHELKLTIKSIIEGTLEQNESTHEILMRTLIQLPNYLDYLAIVQRDIPLALMPLLNDLRSLRQEQPLVNYHLFTPDLSLTMPHQKPVHLSDEKLKNYMQKMRVAYQKGLATIVKNPQKPAEGLKFIHTIMQRLQQATGTAPVTTAWWITGALIEALQDKGLDINKSNFNLLKQLDNLIHQIAQHGNAVLYVEVPPVLLTQLLYFVAQSHSKGQEVSAIINIFQLNDYFPSQETLVAIRNKFSGPDIKLMETVVSLLNEDFVRIQETLDIFNRSDNPSVDELNPLISKLREIAHVLELIGLQHESHAMLAQVKIINEVNESNQKMEFAKVLDMAKTLLSIYATVDMLALKGMHSRQYLSSHSETEFSETRQFHDMLTTVVNEAKKELAQAVESLKHLIENNTRDDALLDVPKHLNLVIGLLTMLSQEQAANLLTQCTQYIEQVFIQEATVPTEETKLQALADVLIGVDIYLDTLAGSPLDAQKIFLVLSAQFSVFSL
ncbi:MAG: hypothetical protein KAH77_06675 [Thiomargarita sp.]|nr:hypothetical protein [Thiomargarita sp.]